MMLFLNDTKLSCFSQRVKLPRKVGTCFETTHIGIDWVPNFEAQIVIVESSNRLVFMRTQEVVLCWRKSQYVWHFIKRMWSGNTHEVFLFWRTTPEYERVCSYSALPTLSLTVDEVDNKRQGDFVNEWNLKGVDLTEQEQRPRKTFIQQTHLSVWANIHTLFGTFSNAFGLVSNQQNKSLNDWNGEKQTTNIELIRFGVEIVWKWTDENIIGVPSGSWWKDNLKGGKGRKLLFMFTEFFFSANNRHEEMCHNNIGLEWCPKIRFVFIGKSKVTSTVQHKQIAKWRNKAVACAMSEC